MTTPWRRAAVAAALVALAACSGAPTGLPVTLAASSPPASTAAPALPATTADVTAAASGSAADDPSGPRYPATRPTSSKPMVRSGDDWTAPAWARPAADSGFFSEDASGRDHVAVRSVDVTWRQLAPTPDGPLDLRATGRAEGMAFAALADQLAGPGPYWLRLFASGTDWAPRWVQQRCGVKGVGPDYEGQSHLPLWDDCVWSALADTWRRLLLDTGVLADPDFRFAYVPGGFTWVEFDYDIITMAAEDGRLTEQQYLAWYDRMLADLAAIAGERVGRLVFTGEDYPWGPFGGAEDLLAAKAVARGFGVRTGITEEANFHLSEAPSYGSAIGADGHLVLTRDDASAQVFASENECYRDCGYRAKDLAHVVVTSNLKALQLQLNWLYVVPSDSYLRRYAAHWDWVRLSLGQRPATAPDAWVALRDAQDTYWSDSFLPGRAWARRPWVRNLERWLVQVDAAGAVAHRATAEVHRGDPTPENGTSREGLRTDAASGNRSLAFRLDPRFLAGDAAHRVLVKVTYLDEGGGRFRLRHPGGRTPAVTLLGSGTWRTATFALTLRPDHSLPAATDLWLDAAGGDVTVRFVRVLRMAAP